MANPLGIVLKHGGKQLLKRTGKEAGSELIQRGVKETIFPITNEAIFPTLKKLYPGGEIAPNGAAEILQGTAKNNAFELNKTLLDDNAVKPTRTILEAAGKGNDDAFDAWTAHSTDFKNESKTTRLTNQVQKNLADAQRQFDGVPPKPEPTEIDLLKEATEDTGTKGRNAESVVLSGGEASAGYGNLGVVDQGLKSQTGGAVTALHHAGFLNELVRGLKAHGSWQRWTEGVNPVVQLLQGKGYKLGHYFENIANVLDVMPKRARTAQKKAIQQHVSDLGGGMHDTTANALLRGSKNVLEMGGDVPKTELGNFESFSKIDSELGRANTGEEFLDVQKLTEVDGKLKKISDPKQKYPKIPVLYPEGHEFAGKLIKEWQPENAAQYHNRYRRTLQILEQAGVNPDTVVKGWNRKAIKIDSNLEIFGADHKAIHAITEALKKRPGNPIYELEQLIKNDLIRDLPDERLAQLIEDQLVTMETVLGNVLQRRYQVISDLFDVKFEGKGYKGFGETFSELGAEAKQDFFLTHITEIARKGGQMNKKLLTLDEALEPLKGWDENITEVFGWKPQTQGRTSAELEPLVKEFQETVPTTMPGG